MPFDPEELVRPLDGPEPLGPELRYEDAFGTLKDLAASVDRPPPASTPDALPPPVDWARHYDRVVELARRGRDLRVWVWLTRAGLAAEGIDGLARGLELIASGLERYWDSLPPLDPDETEPAGRYMARLNTLGELGASRQGVTAAEVTRLRSVRHLLEDVERQTKGTAPAELAPLVARAGAALDRIERCFREGFGAKQDPQLGFEALRGALARSAGAAPRAEAVPAAGARGNGAAPAAPRGADGREDVVRLLDQVLDYYRRHEPSSPVPLLVARAKRLVSMSFFDAMKELAPGGLKELQAVAGKVEDGKAEKAQ